MSITIVGKPYEIEKEMRKRKLIPICFWNAKLEEKKQTNQHDDELKIEYECEQERQRLRAAEYSHLFTCNQWKHRQKRAAAEKKDLKADFPPKRNLK